jgi:hypothetical protein
LAQGAPKTLAAPSQGRSDRRPAARIKEIDAPAHSRVAQTRHGDNLHDAYCPFVQPHDLLTPLVKLLQRLLSCIFFFHLSSIEKIQ